jgi:hypothetical protein
MPKNENASNAGRHEANFETTYSPNTNQYQSDSQADSMPLFCSGHGQYHTDEPGKDNRKPYSQINFMGIQSLVDTPQQVDKQHAQWLIPSTLLSRIFKEQEANGNYYLLWADIDQNPQGICEIAEIIESLIPSCDYEIYTSKSATEDNQKCRILIPLNTPLSGADWGLYQQILNDKLQDNDITPDRASERPAQLCYLPNRGKYYDKKSKRNGAFFDPSLEWANEIRNKQDEIAQQAEELERRSKEAESKREAFKSYSGTSALPDLIGAFNQTYTAQDILLQAGYGQKGNSFRHPDSESGSFSASVKNGKVHSLSSNDPLYTNGGGVGAHDTFSAFTVLQHNRDRDAALKDAGDNWLMIGGESWNQFKRREYAQQKAEESTFESDVHIDDAVDPAESEEKSSFKRVSLADVFSNPPEPQRYIWGKRIPYDALSLLAAHGGTGKSLFAMQLSAHTSTGRSFLGLETEKIKTLFFSAEDSTDTIRRRYAAICEDDGLAPAEVESNLIVLDATDAPCLFHEVNTHGVRTGKTTEHYAELKYLIETESVGFLIVDNASDSFGANPIDRQAVTKFIRALVRLVRDAGGAVLLLSHVNKVTSRNGKKQTDSEGYADSAAWHNAARSRLFLNVVENNGNLSLGHEKNNYGKKQPPLKLAFRMNGSSLQTTNTEQNEANAADNAEVKAMMRRWQREPILKMIHEFYTRGENISVSPNSPGTNVHAMLKSEATYPANLNKTECLAVVRDCQRDGLIVSETYKKPDRHNAERWALTEKGLQFIGEPVSKAEQDMEPTEKTVPEDNITEAENA